MNTKTDTILGAFTIWQFCPCLESVVDWGKGDLLAAQKTSVRVEVDSSGEMVKRVAEEYQWLCIIQANVHRRCPNAHFDVIVPSHVVNDL